MALASQPGSTRLDTWLADHTRGSETIDPYLLVTLRPEPTVPAGCPEP
jgi:hypothetical protein